MEKLSEDKLKKIEKLFLNPPPDSKIAAAKDFGVDFTLLMRKLSLSPQERVEEAREMMIFLDEVRKKGELARRKR